MEALAVLCTYYEAIDLDWMFLIHMMTVLKACFNTPQVEILLRSCKILQESCKILIKIKILIRSCLTFKILKNLSKNLVRS